MADLDTWVSAISAGVSAGAAIASAIAAGMTGWFTYTIRNINRGQLDHAQAVDRAYVSFGGVPVYVLGDPFRKFQVEFNNHGNSPGELMRVAIGFCDAKNIPAEPKYKPRDFKDFIGPGTQSRPLMWPVIEPQNATA